MKSFVVVFLLFISLPLLLGLVGVDLPGLNTENRRKARKPVLEMIYFKSNSSLSSRIKGFSWYFKKYVKDYEYYFNDNLTFKSILLDVQKFLKVDLLRVSPVPEKVVIGTDGWLFLGDNYGDVVKESKGIKVMSDEEIDMLVSNAVETKNAMRQLGSDYLLCVAPNKHSVCGKYLPIPKVGPTTLELFSQRIGNKVKFVDLKEDYVNIDRVLFDRTNTHFDSYGSFYAVQSLLKKLRQSYPDIQLLDIDDYKEVISRPKSDELTRMLRIFKPLEKVSLFSIGDNIPRLQDPQLPVPSTFPNALRYEQRYVNPGKPYKVLVCGDSFMAQMFPFLKGAFGEVTFINENKMNFEAVGIDKPDIVIQEVVERSFDLIMGFQ